MSASLRRLPALLGVVIGALGSHVVVVRGDRTRFGRDQAAARDGLGLPPGRSARRPLAAPGPVPGQR
ncbi:hypothetical protein ACWEGS_32050 [Streptomyces sp. NPDC004822]